jgi:hypothetical protein
MWERQRRVEAGGILFDRGKMKARTVGDRLDVVRRRQANLVCLWMAGTVSRMKEAERFLFSYHNAFLGYSLVEALKSGWSRGTVGNRRPRKMNCRQQYVGTVGESPVS